MARRTPPGSAAGPGRRRRRPLRWALALLVAVWLVPTAALCAAAPGADPKSRIESVRSALRSSALDEAQQQAALEGLDAAASNLATAERLRREIATLQAEAAAESARRKDGPGSPAVDPDRSLEDWARRVPPDADVELLEAMLQQQRGFISERTEQIAQIEAELAKILARPSEIASEIAALARRATDLSAPAGAAGEVTCPLQTDPRRMLGSGTKGTRQ